MKNRHQVRDVATGRVLVVVVDRAAGAIHIPMRQTIGATHRNDGRVGAILDRRVFECAGDWISASCCDKTKPQGTEQEKGDGEFQKPTTRF